MILRLRNKSYEERLKETYLVYPNEVFRMFRGFDNINIDDYVSIDFTSTTRNNGFKIIGKRSRSNEVKHFFFN